MDHLWSPWRMKYMEQDNQKNECIFCDAIHAAKDEEKLVVYKGKANFVMLNRFPYTSGHMMVIPLVHKAFFEDLDDPTQLELMHLITASTQAILKIYHPDGFNIGANIGSGSVAGVQGHLHFHVVPRWEGDSNSRLERSSRLYP